MITFSATQPIFVSSPQKKPNIQFSGCTKDNYFKTSANYQQQNKEIRFAKERLGIKRFLPNFLLSESSLDLKKMIRGAQVEKNRIKKESRK